MTIKIVRLDPWVQHSSTMTSIWILINKVLSKGTQAMWVIAKMKVSNLEWLIRIPRVLFDPALINHITQNKYRPRDLKKKFLSYQTDSIMRNWMPLET